MVSIDLHRLSDTSGDAPEREAVLNETLSALSDGERRFLNKRIEAALGANEEAATNILAQSDLHVGEAKADDIDLDLAENIAAQVELDLDGVPGVETLREMKHPVLVRVVMSMIILLVLSGALLKPATVAKSAKTPAPIADKSGGGEPPDLFAKRFGVGDQPGEETWRLTAGNDVMSDGSLPPLSDDADFAIMNLVMTEMGTLDDVVKIMQEKGDFDNPKAGIYNLASALNEYVWFDVDKGSKAAQKKFKTLFHCTGHFL